MEMCLKSTYFRYRGNFYEQKEGAAMGSLVSSMVANLYIELFGRYIDDTFCILRKGSTQELLHHLNEVRPTIKVTVEQEEDGTLTFLDMLLRRREDGSLDVSVYRNLMHMDRYLHFESHHLTHIWCDVSTTGPEGLSICRTTLLTTLLESSSRTVTQQTSTKLLPNLLDLLVLRPLLPLHLVLLVLLLLDPSIHNPCLWLTQSSHSLKHIVWKEIRLAWNSPFFFWLLCPLFCP